MRLFVRLILPARLRLLAAVATLGALLVPASVGWGAASAHRSGARSVLRAQNAVEAPLVRLINRTRSAHGLPALRISRELVRAAEAHAREMGRQGFFAHESADGTSAGDRIRRFYRVTGRWIVGENLLWRSPDVTPGQALQMWLASPPHRHVLLLASFREIGVAAVHVTAAGGAYGGHDVTIVVADFGGRT